MVIGFAEWSVAHLVLLFFSTFGGLGREATIFYSRLADLLSKKHGTPYTKTLSLMRCSISGFFFTPFCHRLILAIGGSRTVRPVHVECPTTSAELRFSLTHLFNVFILYLFNVLKLFYYRFAGKKNWDLLSKKIICPDGLLEARASLRLSLSGNLITRPISALFPEQIYLALYPKAPKDRDSRAVYWKQQD